MGGSQSDTVEFQSAMNHPSTSQCLQAEDAQSAGVGASAGTSGGPQRSARILLLAILLGLCDQTYWQYSFVDRYQKGYWKSFIDGVGLAPEQYRIGVKMAAWWMVEHFGWGFRHGFVLMDLVSSLTGVFLLYQLLQQRRGVRSASLELQWFASAAFIALSCFYLVWVGSYFRPETLPTAGLLALMVWLWSSWDRVRVSRRVWVAIALAGVAAIQSWVRADVAFALSAGFFLACLIRRRPGEVRDRAWKLVVNLLCVGIAGATQLYIMRVKYPHASYGATPILMIRHDLQQPLALPPFLCFMVPIAWTYVQFWRNRSRGWEDYNDSGLILASLLYLVLWVVLGKLDEVRIFIPFALAMIPLSVDLSLRHVSTASGAGLTRTKSAHPNGV